MKTITIEMSDKFYKRFEDRLEDLILYLLMNPENDPIKKTLYAVAAALLVYDNKGSFTLTEKDRKIISVDFNQ